MHLLKLEHSPAAEPRRGWVWAVRRARQDVEDLLKESPSLRAQLPEMLAQASERALLDAVAALESADEFGAARLIERVGVRYTSEDVLGNGIPPGP